MSKKKPYVDNNWAKDAEAFKTYQARMRLWYIKELMIKAVDFIFEMERSAFHAGLEHERTRKRRR